MLERNLRIIPEIKDDLYPIPEITPRVSPPLYHKQENQK